MFEGGSFFACIDCMLFGVGGGSLTGGRQTQW